MTKKNESLIGSWRDSEDDAESTPARKPAGIARRFLSFVPTEETREEIAAMFRAGMSMDDAVARVYKKYKEHGMSTRQAQTEVLSVWRKLGKS